MTLRATLTICLTSLLVGCATAYQKNSFSGGFEETQLAENVWRVSFHGNGYTRGIRAEELATLRSAELTLAQGYRYFVFTDARTTNEVMSITQPTSSHTNINANVYGGVVSGTARTKTYGGGTTVINKPSAINTVVMFKEKPTVNGLVYEATFICESIGRKYEVKCQ